MGRQWLCKCRVGDRFGFAKGTKTNLGRTRRWGQLMLLAKRQRHEKRQCVEQKSMEEQINQVQNSKLGICWCDYFPKLELSFCWWLMIPQCLPSPHTEKCSTCRPHIGSRRVRMKSERTPRRPHPEGPESPQDRRGGECAAGAQASRAPQKLTANNLRC